MFLIVSPVLLSYPGIEYICCVALLLCKGVNQLPNFICIAASLAPQISHHFKTVGWRPTGEVTPIIHRVRSSTGLPNPPGCIRLIGKLLVNFLFVLIELFSLGVTAEALRANIDWKSAFLKGVDWFWPMWGHSGGLMTLHAVHGSRYKSLLRQVTSTLI